MKPTFKKTYKFPGTYTGVENIFEVMPNLSCRFDFFRWYDIDLGFSTRIINIQLPKQNIVNRMKDSEDYKLQLESIAVKGRMYMSDYRRCTCKLSTCKRCYGYL